MLQNELKSTTGKGRKRVGRGNASGKGRTCGRGDKGQNARKSGGVRIGFEGGQTPLHKRMPKLKGFKNNFKTVYETLNLSSLNILSGEVNPSVLFENGLISKKDSLVKILGNGDLTAKIELKVHKITKSAQEKIEKAGAKVELIS